MRLALRAGEPQLEQPSPRRVHGLQISATEPWHEVLKLCQTCADSCVMCLQCIANGLPQTKQACNVCADICDACAVECDKGGGIMKEYADACRGCAVACRQMGA